MMHSYKSIYLIIFVLLFPFRLSASNYYVNKNASGQNNGTSWANAWRSFSAINWNSIQPGDVIYISGGTDSTIYYERLQIDQLYGTAANPIVIIAGKYAPSSSGHGGRVIIDGGGIRDQSIWIHDSKYVTVKGFECRRATSGVYVEGDSWCSNIVLDSLTVYDFYDQAGILVKGHPNNYSVDSTTIRHCNITTPLLVDGQTDCIYMDGNQHTVIHDCYIRNLNQDPDAHNDAIQGVHNNGFLIYNNIVINDSVYSPEGGGMPFILGAEGNNPVVIYNNFIYMGGAWWPHANMGYGLMARFYSTVNNQPPTWIINNTIVINGPRVRGIGYEYNATSINNIIAMWCPPDGWLGKNWRTDTYNHGWSDNYNVNGANLMSVYPRIDSIRNNLYWKEDNWEIGFSGTYTNNGGSHVGISGWSSWLSNGGTGIKADPLFVHNIGREPDQGTLDGELQAGSPAINAGEDVQALVESFGLPWTDINGNPRNSTPTIGAYEYAGGSDSTFSLSVSIINGWNVVSVPGINPNGMDIDTWWADRNNSSNVFKFDDNYFPVTTTTPGEGYWMKHTGAKIYNTGDEWPAGGIQIVPHNPINATTGWNLIGGYENSASTAAITTNPPGLIGGPIYKFSGIYQVATTINPGYGYWIKLTGSGQLILPGTLSKENETTDWFPKDWGRIVLTDATGINYTLYAVKGEVDLNQYELPPAPPEGMFDIRFSTGRIAEYLNSAIKSIEISGVTYPLTVRVENMDIRLQDETGKQINIDLKSGEDVVISDGTIDKLLVSSELKPTKHTLEQNYPNPFNPSTVIEFSLPEDVSNVKLSIYNALGEKVAELVNTVLTAGKYQYQWNAENVATGIYIYELRTDNFVSVKKMLLMK